jgi:PBSX family phage terminase large subunit
MAIKKKQTIEWGFGDKHKDYIRRCKHNTINVAEGAVRAGKTIDNVFSFAMELEVTADKIHLATGSTAANAKLNIGEANGFGLEHIFRGRSRWGKFKGNECLFIKSITGEKVVIFAGGAKADSYKKIRGNSYGLWIATEINLHHDNTIKEAFNRQLMAENRKIFWDLNPSKPRHWIYTDYIDLYQEKQNRGELVGGYNYEHFTIFDNINLTEQRIKEIISQYDPSSIWYMRDIEGKRMIAEGLIYSTFAENNKKYFMCLDEAKKLLYEHIQIGVDFGGNESKHTFVATGITAGYEKLIALMSEKHDANIDPDELASRYVDFVYRVLRTFKRVDRAYADSAEQVLIRGLKAKSRKEGLNVTIRNSIKNPINDRIRLVQSLIAQDRFYYTEQAETVREALNEAVWDESNEQEIVRLDDGTSDIDTLDAFEYSFERYIRQLMRK